MATYSYKRQGDLDNTLDQYIGTGPYSSQYTDQLNKAAADYAANGTYESKYTGDMEALNKQIGERTFAYDPETDETYQQYKTDYTRYGQQAMDDTLGKLAARTGGLASSYAATAAQNSYNNYMQQLASKIPELKQLAYSMWQDEGQRLQNQFNNYMNLDNNAQGIWSANNNYLTQNLNNYLNLDQNAQNVYNMNLNKLATQAGLLTDDRAGDYNIWNGNEQLALDRDKFNWQKQQAAQQNALQDQYQNLLAQLQALQNQQQASITPNVQIKQPETNLLGGVTGSNQLAMALNNPTYTWSKDENGKDKATINYPTQMYSLEDKNTVNTAGKTTTATNTNKAYVMNTINNMKSSGASLGDIKNALKDATLAGVFTKAEEAEILKNFR